MIAIGVDAGGTGTRALLSKGGARHAELSGGPANASAIGAVAAARSITDIVRAIAGNERPDAIVVGAAGAGRARVSESIERALRDLFPRARIAVGDDAPVALRAAIPAGPGIVLVAGTGSVAYAEHAQRRARIGGAGYLLGDEGSAFSIGLAAIRLYARTLDGRVNADETTDLVARAFEAPDRDALLAAVYDEPLVPARVAALAPSIIAFAGKGNRAATKIVQTAAQELADLVRAAARAVEWTDRNPRIALAGGLFAENSLLSFLLETRINGDLPGAEIVRGSAPPVTGALRLAEELAGAADDAARIF
jgi:N-acetylglucosamine kinase-like BadF-type ATPase